MGRTYDGIKEFIVIPKRIPPPTSSVLNTQIYNTVMRYDPFQPHDSKPPLPDAFAFASQRATLSNP